MPTLEKVHWADNQFVTNPEHVELLCEFASYHCLCPFSFRILQHPVTGELFEETKNSALHWSRCFEWPWAILNAELQSHHWTLDAGGSHAVFQYGLAKRVKEVINFDLSEDHHLAIRHMQDYRGLGKNITLATGDIKALPYGDGFFDRTFCLPAGTVIGGSCTPIDELLLGSQVCGRDGREQQVTDVFRRSYSGDMVRIKVSCVPDILITPEHPVLVSKVRRVHKQARFYHGRDLYEYVASEPIWKPAKDVVVSDWVSVPRLKGSETFSFSFCKGRSKNRVDCVLNENIAWLLGAYVAEGHTSYRKDEVWQQDSHGGVIFSLGASEEGFAERLVSTLNSMGLSGGILRSPSIKHNSLRVYSSCIEFCRLLDSWCGRGAKNKQVPEFIKRAPDTIIRAFISGLVEGDGCVYKDNEVSIGTASSRLAYGVLELLYKVGIHAGLSVRANVSSFGGRIRNGTLYMVRWSKRVWDGVKDAGGRIPYGKGKFIDEFVYLPVKKVDREKVVNLPVYNVHTNDSTYCVPYTVHNCISVLEHDRDWKQCLQELFRVTKPGGICIVTLDVNLNHDETKDEFYISQAAIGELCQSYGWNPNAERVSGCRMPDGSQLVCLGFKFRK